ncbi:hypothetical protein [Streptomyces sp. NPDC102462]|uniref:hypothetical protein n=1 Tax=Streptomyces sp. NPDC102462 TaxID=3366178 RepID=UPI0037F8A255
MRRFRKTPATAVPTTPLVGSTAGWASASSRSAPSGPLRGTAARLTDDSLGKALPDPTTATPPEVAPLSGEMTGTRQRPLLPAGDVIARDAYFTASTLIAVGDLG